MDSSGHPRVRFGIQFGGVHVLLPAGVPTEFVAQTPVYPVPRAPHRLLGLMQLRGQPVPVFDAGPTAPAEVPILRRRDVLLIGSGSDAGAVAVDATPRAITPVSDDAPPGDPGGCFQAALGASYIDLAEPGIRWWLLAPRALFEILSQRVETP